MRLVFHARKRLHIAFILLIMVPLTGLHAQRGSNFLDHLRIGFGGGANAAHIIDMEAYNIYEDLSGAESLNNYSHVLENISNQYFVQMEWYREGLTLVLKPGTYSYRFTKQNELEFNQETFEQNTPYLLRYLGIPLEVRYNLDMKRFRPYAGVTLAFSHLLASHDAANDSFIPSRFTAGFVAGTYVDLGYLILDLNLGYMSGLHNITSKAERFGTGSGQTFAQNDLLLNSFQVNLSILFSLQKQKYRAAVECYY